MGAKALNICAYLFFIVCLQFCRAYAEVPSRFGQEKQSNGYIEVNVDDQLKTSVNKEPIDIELTDNHKLLNVTQVNNATVVGKLRTTVIEWMRKPYVHGILFPAIVGIACAFVLVVSVISIRACVKAQARRRRRQRIRNLADELKTDKTMLLGESSDDEF